jgi:Lon protease-like protein
MTYELAMFPLEQAVLPTTIVPLHVFEPRYRTLAAAVTALDDPEFGIAPIERGREVGGDDVRGDVGVVARVVEAEEFDDGRWALVVVATRRIRIREWLPDDPHPRALVEDWPDEDAADYRSHLGEAPTAGIAVALDRIRAAVQRLRPGTVVPPPALDDDPALATWQAAVFAQLTPYDATTLLRTPGAAERRDRAETLIGDRAEVLEALADQAG